MKIRYFKFIFSSDTKEWFETKHPNRINLGGYWTLALK